jgi:hypothetical protein
MHKRSISLFMSILGLGLVFLAAAWAARPGVTGCASGGGQEDVVEADVFRIRDIRPGVAGPGISFFSASVTNKTEHEQLLGLDLRADPGLWLRKVQRQYAFRIGPRETRRIEAAAIFLHMSPEATLRVAFGVPGVSQWGLDIGDVFFKKTFAVGRENVKIDYDLSRFHKKETAHFEIYTREDRAADRDIEDIARTREKGFEEIAGILQVKFPRKIRLFLFPDAETKLKETGHTGAGWAFANNIVEIYNDQVRLDPYHEVVHILADGLGDPPAMFSEGLAVYLSERLGGDALKFLGNPGETVDDVARGLIRADEAMPWGRLLTYTEIGSEESRPKIAYAESASIVKFLIEKEGLAKFREAYASLKNDSDPETVARNCGLLERIYGRSLEDIERDWRQALR